MKYQLKLSDILRAILLSLMVVMVVVPLLVTIFASA